MVSRQPLGRLLQQAARGRAERLARQQRLCHGGQRRLRAGGRRREGRRRRRHHQVRRDGLGGEVHNRPQPHL